MLKSDDKLHEGFKLEMIKVRALRDQKALSPTAAAPTLAAAPTGSISHTPIAASAGTAPTSNPGPRRRCRHQQVGFVHMRIADGVGTLLQLQGLMGRLCMIANKVMPPRV